LIKPGFDLVEMTFEKFQLNEFEIKFASPKFGREQSPFEILDDTLL